VHDLITRVEGVEQACQGLLTREADTLVAKPLRMLNEEPVEVEAEPHEPAAKDGSVDSSGGAARELRCLKASAWEAGAIAGLHDMRLADALVALLVVVVNFALQALFVYQLQTMISSPLDDEAILNLRLWRLFQGHSIDNLDSTTGSSLTSRVCDDYSGNGVAGPQIAILQNLKRYLGLTETDGGGGYLLCLLSILVWHLMVVRELKNILLFSSSIVALGSSRTEVANSGERRLVIESLSYARVMSILLFISLPWCLIVCALGYVGVMYLTFTTSTADLILIVITLGFILDIPTMVFAVLMPSRMSSMLMDLEPLPVPPKAKMRRCCCIDIRPICSILVVVASMFAVNALLVAPFFSRMEKAVDTLCDKHTDFVFAYDKASGLVFSSPTSPWPGPEVVTTRSKAYSYRSLLARSGLDDGEEYDNVGRLSMEVPLNLLTRISSLSTQESADISGCEDTMAHQGGGLMQEMAESFSTYVRLAIGEEDTSCAQLQRYCGQQMPSDLQAKGVMPTEFYRVKTAVRSMCSVSCGCTDPFSGIYVSDGCPAQCAVIRGERQRTHFQIQPCADRNANELQRDEAWKGFWQDFYAASGLLMGINESVIESTSTRGCAILVDFPRLKARTCFDDSTASRSSIQAFCPVTCGVSCNTSATR